MFTFDLNQAKHLTKLYLLVTLEIIILPGFAEQVRNKIINLLFMVRNYLNFHTFALEIVYLEYTIPSLILRIFIP